MRRILLVEPGYRNKYPPLGLMKISAYHKLRGDHVEFSKGCSRAHREYGWDRVYVASLFTFHWKKTLRTIEYYAPSIQEPRNIWVGGVLATLMNRELAAFTGATVVTGLLDRTIGAKITSFPMRYVPLTDRDRSHVATHWNRRLLGGIQCILLSTRGVVSPNPAFFDAAFGRDCEEFIRIEVVNCNGVHFPNLLFLILYVSAVQPPT